MWLIDRGDTENAKASITGRGRDILDFSYEVKWNETSGDMIGLVKRRLNAMKIGLQIKRNEVFIFGKPREKYPS